MECSCFLNQQLKVFRLVTMVPKIWTLTRNVVFIAKNLYLSYLIVQYTFFAINTASFVKIHIFGTIVFKFNTSICWYQKQLHYMFISRTGGPFRYRNVRFAKWSQFRYLGIPLTPLSTSCDTGQRLLQIQIPTDFYYKYQCSMGFDYSSYTKIKEKWEYTFATFGPIFRFFKILRKLQVHVSASIWK